MKKLIVVIEDDREISNTIQEVLTGCGYTVLGATNGNDGRHLITTQKPDLVLTDMMMPRMGGFPVLEFLAEMENPPPAIMCTANEGSRHKAYAEMLGVVDYLRKPFAMETLVESVRQALAPSERTNSAIDATIMAPFENEDTKTLVLQSDLTFNVAIASMAGAFCHDFGNSLFHISTLFDRERNELETKDKIQNALTAATEHIDDLHQLARQFYTSEADPLSQIFLDDLEESITYMAKPILGDRQDTLTIDSRIDDDEFSIARVVLRHLVIPLVQNAVEATDQIREPREIRLQLERAQFDQTLTILVSDNGPGWPKPPAVMLEGFRMPRGFSTKGPSRGSGLRNVLRITEEIGGQLVLGHCDRAGAEVVLILPDAHPIWPEAQVLPPQMVSAIAEVVGSFCHRFKNHFQRMLLYLASEKDNHTEAITTTVETIDRNRLELHRFVRRFYSMEESEPSISQSKDLCSAIDAVLAKHLYRSVDKILTKVTGDPLQMPIAVFLCLVGPIIENAVEELDAGGDAGAVRVFVHHEQSESKLFITISDSGRGWPVGSQTALDHVLDSGFFSLKGADRGLGLPTLARLVKKLMGEIAFDDSEDGGARVRVIVPTGDWE